MKHIFKPMTFKERHSGGVPTEAEDPPSLPTVRVEMPEKMLKKLSIGDSVELVIKGKISELFTEFGAGLTVEMKSVEIPGNTEVKELL